MKISVPETPAEMAGNVSMVLTITPAFARRATVAKTAKRVSIARQRNDDSSDVWWWTEELSARVNTEVVHALFWWVKELSYCPAPGVSMGHLYIR